MHVNLDQPLVPPGLYSANRKWKNEWGYTWQRNDHVLVIEQYAPGLCLCAFPGENSLGLRFDLTTERIRSSFRFIGPLP
jgi:hypothetical protein